MMWRHNRLRSVAAMLLLLSVPPMALAATPMSDRLAMETGVRAELSKDLAATYIPKAGLESRRCIDGRAVEDFQGDIVEYWVNLECPYCQVFQPVMAQRRNADICIVVRHIPTPEYGESLKKALTYEALHGFSPNAAHRFWEGVLPKTDMAIPMPMEGAFLSAMQDAAISPDTLSDALTGSASRAVDADILAAQGRISSTPTYVLAGMRFSSCDFKAGDLPAALELAKKARIGDAEARTRSIEIITNGHMGEKML